MTKSRSLYLRDPDILAADMDGDTVMMSISKGSYFGIGGVGTRIWDLLSEPIALEHIVETILAEYDVEEAECYADTQGFITLLVENGLVRLV